MNLPEFQRACESISETLYVDVSFYPEDIGQDPYEDDGLLHITKCGLRAVFDVGNGQSLTASRQNKRARAVLTALNLPMTDNTTA